MFAGLATVVISLVDQTYRLNCAMLFFYFLHVNHVFQPCLDVSLPRKLGVGLTACQWSGERRSHARVLVPGRHLLKSLGTFDVQRIHRLKIIAPQTRFDHHGPQKKIIFSIFGGWNFDIVG